MDLSTLFKPFLLSFIPLFIAMGAFDFAPFLMALTEGFKKSERRRVVREGTLAAGLILITFLFVGKAVLLVLGVSVSDFLVAGGLLLLVLAIKSLVVDNQHLPRPQGKEISIVPLATPLIAGPAAMATTLILLDTYGALITLLSILCNCLVAWAILDQAPRLQSLVGKRGMQGLSKLSYILLASIAVMMLRRGLNPLAPGL